MNIKRILFLFFALIVLGLVVIPAAAQSGLGALDSPTPTPTAFGPGPTATPDPVDMYTSTPQPTLVSVPTATPTSIPLSAESGMPLVLPVLQSGLPDDGYGPVDYPVYINPLTGMPVPDPALLDRRPIAIKVTNYPRYVRPQSGLSLADLVFEYYMEWGIPRFIAVFYGQDAEKVGPIRSGRLFDEHIFRMYDSYFAFGYADPRVREYFFRLGDDISNRFILESNLDAEVVCGPDTYARLCRDHQLEGYNTMFGNTKAIRDYAQRVYNNNTRPDLTGMAFSPHTPPSILPATIVKVRFSSSIFGYWEYDPISSSYLRWQETGPEEDIDKGEYEPLYDTLTGRRISADNVVVLVVKHKFEVYHENTDEVLSMNLNGSGPAYIYRDGFAYQGQWERPADGGVLRIYDMNGQAFPLRPGQTWFEVVSTETTLDHEGYYWFFDFQLPDLPEEGRLRLNPEADPLSWFFRDQNPTLPWPDAWGNSDYP